MTNDCHWAEGQRLLLRQVQEPDLALASSWLEGQCLPCMPFQSIESSTPFAVVCADQGAPAGFLFWAAGDPGDGWLTIQSIVIEPTQRRRGLGGEAVLFLEEGARRRRLADRFRGLAPLDNGLSLYFWLRLGYRPTSVGQGRYGQPVLWMVRDQVR